MTIEKFIGTPIFNGESIIYNAVVTKHFEYERRTDVETIDLEFHGDGFIFANEFLDIVNKALGTNYEFDPSYKNEVGKKHGNINIHKDFALRNYGSKFELLHHYDYDSVKGCCATYGEYSKETILAFADAVDAYNKGKRGKATEFNPTYKDDTELNKVLAQCAEDRKGVESEIEKAVEGLNAVMEGKPLENATRAVREGYRWTLSSIRDKEWDAERNNYLDGMERVAKDAKKGIKRYKDYFTDEIVNTKRDRYHSSDDRYRSSVYIKYETKDQESYFYVTPYEIEGKIRFRFKGGIVVKRWREDPIKNYFDLYGLTYEEMLMVNDEYNKMWYDAKWGKK